MTLTECVQRCWLLVVCGFEKILMTGLAEAKRQLCLQSLHNLPYIGLLLRNGGLLTPPIKVFNFNGVGLEATTVLLDSFGLNFGFDGCLLEVWVVNTNRGWLIGL